MGKPLEEESDREERGLWIVDLISTQSKGPLRIGEAAPIIIKLATWARDSREAIMICERGAKRQNIVVVGFGDVKHIGVVESMIVQDEEVVLNSSN